MINQQEIVMNLNTLIPAQTLAHNRMVFDQQALERSILRAEARHAYFKAIWAKLRAGIANRAKAQTAAKIATQTASR